MIINFTDKSDICPVCSFPKGEGHRLFFLSDGARGCGHKIDNQEAIKKTEEFFKDWTFSTYTAEVLK